MRGTRMDRSSLNRPGKGLGNRGSAMILTLTVCSVILILGTAVLGAALFARRGLEQSRHMEESFCRLEAALAEICTGMELAAEEAVCEGYEEVLLFLCREPLCGNDEANGRLIDHAEEALAVSFGLEDSDSEARCSSAADRLKAFAEPWEAGELVISVGAVEMTPGEGSKEAEAALVFRDVSLKGSFPETGICTSLTADIRIGIPYLAFVNSGTPVEAASPSEMRSMASPGEAEPYFCGSFVTVENWRRGGAYGREERERPE